LGLKYVFIDFSRSSVQTFIARYFLLRDYAGIPMDQRPIAVGRFVA
jgi:hypothetical protein